MLNAKHLEEPDNNDDVPSSDPSSEPKVSPTHVHSNSISEDPALTETSEPTRNGQEVHYVGEVRTPSAPHIWQIIEVVVCHLYYSSLCYIVAVYSISC